MEIGADSSLRFGRELREERERREVSLEEVARGTRFSMRHLQSLEADLFDELPGGVLRKGIVRSYCKYLGLDDEVWIERFQASGGLDSSETDLSQFVENVHRARMEAMPPVRRRWWGVVAMVAGLLLLAWALWHFVLRPRMASLRPPSPLVSQIAPEQPAARYRVESTMFPWLLTWRHGTPGAPSAERGS